jgi:hypothetical protein
MEDTRKEEIENDNNNDKLIEDMDRLLNPGGMTFNRKKRVDEEEIKKRVGKFWGSQPVPQFQGDEITENDIGPIDKNNDVNKEDKEQVFLPKGYIWWDVDIHNEEDLTKVYINNLIQ